MNSGFSNKFNFKKKYYNIVILGDSLAENWIYNTNDVLNLGIGSQTSTQIKFRSNIYKDYLEGDKLIIFAGGNDVKSICTNPDRVKEIVQNALINIEQIINNHKNKFKKIIVITIPPIFKIPIHYRTLYSKNITEADNEINEGIRKIAMDNNIELIDSYKIFVPIQKKEKLSDDGIHLNKKGYQYLEDEINKLLNKD